MSILPRSCASGLLRPKRLCEVDGTAERALRPLDGTMSAPPPLRASYHTKRSETYKDEAAGLHLDCDLEPAALILRSLQSRRLEGSGGSRTHRILLASGMLPPH